MARHILNHLILKNLKPKEGKKITKYNDGDGLYFWVYDDGVRSYKRWVFKYTFHKVTKEFAIGKFPEWGAYDAREKAEECRGLLKQGKDPCLEKKLTILASQTNLFEELASEWMKIRLANHSEGHKKHVWAALVRNVFPYIGKRPIKDILPPEILGICRRVEKRGAVETAHRVLSACRRIFDYAIAIGVCLNNPCIHISSALKPVKENHLVAPTDPKQVGIILKICDSYIGSPIVRAALKILPYVFTRPGELRQAKWEDIDFYTAEWRFTASKTSQPHIVPLCKQVIEILKDLYFITGKEKYVFPGTDKNRAMSNNTLIMAYRRMGLSKEITGHGWRATARTLLDEVLEYPPYIIDQQLAHRVKDPNGRAYNRTHHLEQRKKMMQEYADYLDRLANELESKNDLR